MSWLERCCEIDDAKAHVLRSKIDQIALFDEDLALRAIRCILRWTPEEFLEACFFLSHRPASQTVIRIPEPLREIAKLRSGRLGEGELLVLFIAVDTACSFGNREDVTLLGEKWHVKKIEKGRSVLMGASAENMYCSSEIAYKLASIERVFSAKITEEMIQKHVSQISEMFGSVEEMKVQLLEECLSRELSVSVGFCVYNSKRENLEFYRRTDIELEFPSQGRYKLKLKSLKDASLEPILKRLDSVGRLSDVSCISTYALPSDSPDSVNLVEIVLYEDDARPIFEPEHGCTSVRVSVDVWNDIMRSRRALPLPADWNWNRARSVK